VRRQVNDHDIGRRSRDARNPGSGLAGIVQRQRLAREGKPGGQRVPLGRGRLRVSINQVHLATLRELGGQVHGQRGFADAPLEVADCEDGGR
jgi:hypothetical protein